MSLGHYVSMIRDGTSWKEYDDVNVRNLSLYEAMDVMTPKRGYLFFYIHATCLPPEVYFPDEAKL